LRIKGDEDGVFHGLAPAYGFFSAILWLQKDIRSICKRIELSNGHTEMVEAGCGHIRS
jgi:hypothetical protein